MDIPTDRPILGLLGLVIAVVLAAGIVGAVKVSSRQTSKVAAGAQPSLGPQLQAGSAPETSTSTAVPQATVLTAVPSGVVSTSVSSASAGTVPSAPTTSSPPRGSASTTSIAQPSCTASVSDSTPQPGQKETIAVDSQLVDKAVTVTVHYASGDVVYKATTSASGQAQVSFTIRARERPGPVTVDVSVGGQEQCKTSFTIL